MDFVGGRAILSPLNKQVQDMNHCIVSNLPDPQDSATHLYSADSVARNLKQPGYFWNATSRSFSEKPRGYHDVAKS